MKTVKGFLSRIFIDGLSGMGLGLFATLIIGTIMKQIGDLIGGNVGMYISTDRRGHRCGRCLQI